LDWLILIASLVVVTLGAEGLVRGASALALRMGVSPLFVGLSLVGFGTSSPELAASIMASLRGSSDLSLGNVIGSNIFNIGIIVGIASLIRPMFIQIETLRRDLLMVIFAAAAPWAGFVVGGRITAPLGLAFLFILALYLSQAYRSARRATQTEDGLASRELSDSLLTGQGDSMSGKVPRQVALLLGGLAMLIVGSKFFVDSAVDIARVLGVSERVIGLTLVAAGTSLPELATSVVASLRGDTDIAIGNIIGSNLFNVFGILGTAALIRPLPLGQGVLLLDLAVMMLATLALIPILRTGGVISRLEGAMLLAGYSIYLAHLISMGP